jgi:hypothetical protein
MDPTHAKIWPIQDEIENRRAEREIEASGRLGLPGAGDGGPVVEEGVPELAFVSGRLGPTSLRRGGGPAMVPWHRAGEATWAEVVWRAGDGALASGIGLESLRHR